MTTKSDILSKLEQCLLSGMSYEAVSAELGKSTGALKSLKFRWLKHLGSFDFGNNFRHGDCIPSGRKVSRLYTTWTGMKSRCYNKEVINYKRYGGRGIKICDDWHDYIKFKEWAILNGYADNLEIDRIGNDGDYEPNNCQWLSHAENTAKGNKLKRKLTDKEVMELKHSYMVDNVTQNNLAEKYDICQTQIGRILRNEIYKEVQLEALDV